jgi:hypothetical protein
MAEIGAPFHHLATLRQKTICELAALQHTRET